VGVGPAIPTLLTVAAVSRRSGPAEVVAYPGGATGRRRNGRGDRGALADAAAKDLLPVAVFPMVAADCAASSGLASGGRSAGGEVAAGRPGWVLLL